MLPAVADSEADTEAQVARAERKAHRSRLALRIISYASPFVLVLIWELLAVFGVIRTNVLPAPSAVLVTGWELLLNGTLVTHLLVSLGRALTGFALGLVIGLGLGLVVGLSRLGDALLDRPLQMIRAVPFFAVLPLVIIWFGVGEEGKIFLVTLAVTFPVYLNTTLGIRQVDPKLLELGRVLKLPRHRVLTEIVIAGALPSILNGVRIALASSWLALTVVETIGARSGIGFLSSEAREFLRTDIIVLTLFIYAIIGIVSDVIARALEKRLLAWHPNYAKRGG